MLSVNSISRGIVIDHITCGNGYKIFKLLKLDEADYTVALIMNAISQKKGRKDIIKIENVIDIDFRILGILDDSLTINVIEDEKIKEKIELNLPEHIDEFLVCKNPRCITQTERNIKNSFTLVDPESKTYKCDYCDQFYNMEEI
ncbi:MAG: aspartate carbamoyltransferase regulatory subunit [Finegoldia sp.]|nr:aspartate carbamoyltransferase regulatory subunit [Finegoldia sp.]